MKHHILLDRSGSMISRWDEMVSAINEYIGTLASDERVYVSAFDSPGFDRDMDYVNLASNLVGGAKINVDLQPRGGTPLFDAIGKTFEGMVGAERGVIVVITDGHENTSREFTADGVKKLVESNKERGIEAIFIGASLEDLTDANRSGFRLDTSLTVSDGKYGEAMRNLSSKTTAYSSGAGGQSLGFSDAEKADLS